MKKVISIAVMSSLLLLPVASQAKGKDVSPKFKDYPVTILYVGKPATPEHEDGAYDRMVEAEKAALSGAPTFAGEYVYVMFSNGGGSYTEYFINKRTGKSIGEFGTDANRSVADCRVDSSLLVAEGPILDSKGGDTKKYAAYFYLLKNDELELIKTIETKQPEGVDQDDAPKSCFGQLVQ